jgi:hypothetical protein
MVKKKNKPVLKVFLEIDDSKESDYEDENTEEHEKSESKSMKMKEKSKDKKKMLKQFKSLLSM